MEPLQAEPLHQRGSAGDLAGDEAEGDAAGDEPRVRQARAQLEDEALLLREPQPDIHDVRGLLAQVLLDPVKPLWVTVEAERRAQRSREPNVRAGLGQFRYGCLGRSRVAAEEEDRCAGIRRRGRQRDDQ